MSDREPIEAAGFKLFRGEGALWIAHGDCRSAKEAMEPEMGSICVSACRLGKFVEGLRQAKRWYGEEAESNLPSPEPNPEAALAMILGIACMVLGANLGRVSGAYRLSEGRIDIGLRIDGRPLYPSEIAEVEQAIRAVRGER